MCGHMIFSLALAAAAPLAKCYSFYVKVFYLMGKALSGELSCPCDRSCYNMTLSTEYQRHYIMNSDINNENIQAIKEAG